MEFHEAPKSTTTGVDESHRMRAEFVANVLRPRVALFNGHARPDDPASASKTKEDLAQLASDTSKMHRGAASLLIFGRPDWTCQSR